MSFGWATRRSLPSETTSLWQEEAESTAFVPRSPRVDFQRRPKWGAWLTRQLTPTSLAELGQGGSPGCEIPPEAADRAPVCVERPSWTLIQATSDFIFPKPQRAGVCVWLPLISQFNPARDEVIAGLGERLGRGQGGAEDHSGRRRAGVSRLVRAPDHGTANRRYGRMNISDVCEHPMSLGNYVQKTLSRRLCESNWWDVRLYEQCKNLNRSECGYGLLCLHMVV